MPRHFLIDTDAGSDDAVALILALKHPDVSIEAITVVAGNIPVDLGVQNALYTVELCGDTVPVHRGMPLPLIRPLETAQFVHGEDGMGDIGLPLTGRVPASLDALPVLRDTIHKYAGDITLVTLGPLTNIAVAIRQGPSIVKDVSECIVMCGTGQGYGNITPVGEYNFWADPEAAKIVFESGMPITMVGWDVSRTYATFNPEDTAALRDIGTPLAQFCVDTQRCLEQFALNQTQLEGFDLPDPIAMAVALYPSVITVSKQCYVTVEAGSASCRGQSVVDHLGVTGREPNAKVVLEVSREKFLHMLYFAVS